jgi:hypothetical protein
MGRKGMAPSILVVKGATAPSFSIPGCWQLSKIGNPVSVRHRFSFGVS